MARQRDGRATLRDLFQVMRDPTLSAEEKVTWALVRSYERAERGAFVSVETLADHMDAGVRSVERWRSSLISSGLLVRERLRGPKPAEYRAVLPEAPPDMADHHAKAPPQVADQGASTSASGGGARSATGRGAGERSAKRSATSSASGGGQSTGSTGSTEGTDAPLRSASEVRPRVENVTRDEGGGSADEAPRRSPNRAHDTSHRRAGSEGGPAAAGQAIAARFLPLIREKLYVAGPPRDFSESQEVSVLRRLLRHRPADEVEDAILGLAWLRDHGVLSFAEKGETLTTRALYNTHHGLMPVFEFAVHAARKHELVWRPSANRERRASELVEYAMGGVR